MPRMSMFSTTSPCSAHCSRRTRPAKRRTLQPSVPVFRCSFLTHQLQVQVQVQQRRLRRRPTPGQKHCSHCRPPGPVACACEQTEPVFLTLATVDADHLACSAVSRCAAFSSASCRALCRLSALSCSACNKSVHVHVPKEGAFLVFGSRENRR